MLSDMRIQMRALFRRKEVEGELDDELRFHLEKQVEKYVASGMTREEAMRRARLEFGGTDQVKEECRDARGVRIIETLAQDVRYGARMLRKSPGFTATAVLTLALGIGANTAIFSVVNAVLLRPLAYKDPQDLVTILEAGHNPVDPADFLDWRAQNHVFDRMGAAESWSADLTGRGTPEHINALHLTSDVLPLLGVQPKLGRFFSPAEEHAGHEHVIVLSYGLWKDHFATDPNILGTSIALDGESYTIVGIMPQGFRFAPYWATKAELWAPLVLDARESDRNGSSLRLFARLKEGVSLNEARAEMAAITARLAAKFPGTNQDIAVIPLQEKVVGDVRAALSMLLGAVLLVLLIACANVAHLQLIRSAARTREMAVRSALGASQGRVIRQSLTESAILAVMGGLFGLLFGYGGVRLLVSVAPRDIPRVDTISMDARAFAFMLTITAIAAVTFGLAPALRSSSVDLNDSLKEAGRTSMNSARRSRFRNWVVASEFALALVLLVGAGLVIRSFYDLLSVKAGFDPHHVISAVVSVTGSKEADPNLRAAFFQDVTQKVSALPGVDSVSMINHLPLHGDIWGFPFSIEGRPPALPGERPVGAFRVVLPGYFRTMRIPILKGRDFTSQDVLNAQHVVIINDFMARHHWPGEDPIGQRITTEGGTNPDWSTIVGIAADAKESNWAGRTWEEMYFPFLQSQPNLEGQKSAMTYMTLVARTASPPSVVVPTIRQAVWSIDKNIPVSDVITMDDAVDEQVAAPRFYALLLAIFSFVALALGAVGIYGVMSYSVARRTHEIGVRMALGAKGADVFRLVVIQGMQVAAIGGGIGLLSSLELMRLLRAVLFGVRPTDPLTFVVSAVVLAVVALVACYVPARRAMRVDPMVALRYE